MQEIAQSQSQLIQNDHNQFLSQYLEYESCPFCFRSFFRGKLAYHLKLCSNQNPMIKSNKNSPRHKKNVLSAPSNYQRCNNCNSKIPSYISEKHKQSCKNASEKKLKKSQQTKQSQKSQQKYIQETIFPKIKNYASQENTKTTKRIAIKPMGPSIIKVRDELRCFRIAQKVQQIECEFCNRKFSKQAAERHVPICMNLKQKQKKQIVFFKESKNMVIQARKSKLQGLGKSYQVVSSKTFTLAQKPINNSTFQILNPQSKPLGQVTQQINKIEDPSDEAQKILDQVEGGEDGNGQPKNQSKQINDQ